MKPEALRFTKGFWIRFTPADHERVKAAAAADGLEVATWGRQAVLKALDRRGKR